MENLRGRFGIPTIHYSSTPTILSFHISHLPFHVSHLPSHVCHLIKKVNYVFQRDNKYSID